MNLERYPVKASPNNRRFQFTSKGPKGKVTKVVFFQKMGDDKYNLAFGDWNKKTRSFDARIRSNNGDRDKVLATVAHVVLLFFNHYENASVEIEGQTKGRTRLYQMAINKYFEELSILYEITGVQKNNFEVFRSGKNYESFIVKKH